MELHYSLLSRLFGTKAFAIYAVPFFIFLLARPAFLTALAIASEVTLPVNRTVLYILAAVVAALALYVLYSVLRYFGITRAAGIDHFDPSYRRKPLVKEGIFKSTGNAMYIFGLLALWIPGLLAASAPGLLAAALTHAYIWVHYCTTEKPDMDRIYGP
jgi:hypothetical protein